MLIAVALEGLSSALNVSRREVTALYERLEQRAGQIGADLNRRFDAALAADIDVERRVAAVKHIAASAMDRESIKFVLGMAGVAYGAGVAATGLVTGGSIAVAGLGLTVTPFVAVVAGILLMVVCGRFCMRTLSRLFDEARQLAAVD